MITLSALKWLSYLLGLVLVLAVFVVVTVTWIERRQARDLQSLAPYVSPVAEQKSCSRFLERSWTAKSKHVARP